jgi:DNA-binding transcriptional regulator YhcF (GntR family)
MKSTPELIRRLRDQIVGMMHVGQLHSGDRLPSIRELAVEWKRNPRTVAAVYDALAAEGLVEIRGRSGVFVARQEVLVGDLREETAGWLSDIITEGWKRRFSAAEVVKVLQRCTESVRIRCGLVEVIEDAIVAMRYELETEFGFDVRPISPDALTQGRNTFNDIDFFATTSFYAPLVHARVASLRKELVVLTIYPVLREAIRHRLEEGQLKVIACDAKFGERIRIAYAPNRPDAVRTILARDRASVERIDRDEPVLLTRAAHEALGPVHVRMLFPHSPTISLEAASNLAQILVMRNLRNSGAAGTRERSSGFEKTR